MKASLLPVLTIALAATVACRREPPLPVTKRCVLMGTEVTVTAWDGARSSEEIGNAIDAAFARMKTLENVLSRHDETSDLSRLNRRAGEGPVEVDAGLLAVLRRARDAFDTSGGAFDPTVGPLVDLWIAAAKNDRVPSMEAVRTARERTGFDRVRIDEKAGTVSLPEGFALDLGGIAKGYIVDAGASVLREAGIRNGLLEAGGDLYAFGARPGGGAWRVGVQDPAAGESVSARLIARLAVSDRGVTTSGHYRRFSVIEGKRFSHILDPRTGFPVEQAVLSVTVIAPDAAEADGLSTAVAVLGRDDGLARIDSLPGVEALVVEAGDEGGYAFFESSGFSAYAR